MLHIVETSGYYTSRYPAGVCPRKGRVRIGSWYIQFSLSWLSRDVILKRDSPQSLENERTRSPSLKWFARQLAMPDARPSWWVEGPQSSAHVHWIPAGSSLDVVHKGPRPLSAHTHFVFFTPTSSHTLSPEVWKYGPMPTNQI